MSYLEPQPQYSKTYMEILGAMIIVIILGAMSYCTTTTSNAAKNSIDDENGQHIMYRD